MIAINIWLKARSPKNSPVIKRFNRLLFLIKRLRKVNIIGINVNARISPIVILKCVAIRWYGAKI